MAIAGAVSAIPAQASSGGPVGPTSFGMHIPQIAQGTAPSVSDGAIRLLDSGGAWCQVQQKANQFWWNGLDASIGAANTQNLKIMYVLGLSLIHISEPTRPY